MNAAARKGTALLNCLLWRLLPQLSVGHHESKPGIADPLARLIFLSSAGKVIATSVTVAATFAARRRGLLECDGLHTEEGLLLAPGGSVHTVGMRFAIDVVFLDPRMEVLKCVHSMPPWRGALAPFETQYVLELAAGRAAATGIDVGTKLFWLECRMARIGD